MFVRVCVCVCVCVCVRACACVRAGTLYWHADHCGGVSTRLAQVDALFAVLSSPAVIAFSFSAHDSALQVPRLTAQDILILWPAACADARGNSL